jgi:hypothetical protein
MPTLASVCFKIWWLAFLSGSATQLLSGSYAKSVNSFCTTLCQIGIAILIANFLHWWNYGALFALTWLWYELSWVVALQLMSAESHCVNACMCVSEWRSWPFSILFLHCVLPSVLPLLSRAAGCFHGTCVRNSQGNSPGSFVFQKSRLWAQAQISSIR